MVLDEAQLEAPNLQNIAHTTSWRGQSSGWIVTYIPIMHWHVPRSRVIMPLMKASTETYRTVKGGLGMLQFMLCLSGDERSKMRHHFLAWLLLGITLKQLMYKDWELALEKDLPPCQERLHFASRSQSLISVQKSYACSKIQTRVTPRRGWILSEIHPVCEKSHILQAIRRDDTATPLDIDPTVMVKP